MRGKRTRFLWCTVPLRSPSHTPDLQYNLPRFWNLDGPTSWSPIISVSYTVPHGIFTVKMIVARSCYNHLTIILAALFRGHYVTLCTVVWLHSSCLGNRVLLHRCGRGNLYKFSQAVILHYVAARVKWFFKHTWFEDTISYNSGILMNPIVIIYNLIWKY